MSGMYPIIRRVRRPLMPVEVDYCSCCGKVVRQEEPAQQVEGQANRENDRGRYFTEDNKGNEGET